MLQTNRDGRDDISDRMDEFARELTKLSRRYRIGLEGAVAYSMEYEDLAFGYEVNDDSQLIRA
jgi:hypothetical protein